MVRIFLCYTCPMLRPLLQYSKVKSVPENPEYVPKLASQIANPTIPLEYQPPNEGPAKKRRTGRHPRLYKVENDIWGLVSEFAGTTESNMLALSSAHMNNALSMNMASQAVRHRNKIVVNDALRLRQWMESYPHVPFRVAHIDIRPSPPQCIPVSTGVRFNEYITLLGLHCPPECRTHENLIQTI